MKTNYGDLERLKVGVIKGARKKRGLVVGCEYALGITIVDANDHKCILLCIVRETAIEAQKLGSYRKIFHTTVGQIQAGTVDVAALVMIAREHTAGGYASQDTLHAACAFS